jgi:hypothetical protein
VSGENFDLPNCQSGKRPQPHKFLIFDLGARTPYLWRNDGQNITPHPSDFCSTLDIKVGFKSEKPQEATSGLSSSAQALLALSTENQTASQQPIVGAIEKESDGLLW